MAEQHAERRNDSDLGYDPSAPGRKRGKTRISPPTRTAVVLPGICNQGPRHPTLPCQQGLAGSDHPGAGDRRPRISARHRHIECAHPTGPHRSQSAHGRNHPHPGRLENSLQNSRKPARPTESGRTANLNGHKRKSDRCAIRRSRSCPQSQKTHVKPASPGPAATGPASMPHRPRHRH